MIRITLSQYNIGPIDFICEYHAVVERNLRSCWQW